MPNRPEAEAWENQGDWRDMSRERSKHSGDIEGAFSEGLGGPIGVVCALAVIGTARHHYFHR
jgi:hypothetical protein